MVYFLCKVYDSDRQNCYFALSLPVWGAWIEIGSTVLSLPTTKKSLPVWGAWIEMRKYRPAIRRLQSLPVWGAWIEISADMLVIEVTDVAPRVGSVD